MENKNHLYKSDSLHLAAFLIAKGCELAEVERLSDDSRKLLFCFPDTNKLQNLLSEFFALRAKVRPQDFANAQRTLKTIIFAQK
ncbi:hypothetical protein HZB78_03605 [Candidatus Collierbacteria bacterium]|nr:hypothetical protein [Candidatus Collierbacteria bacterium]